VRETKEPDTEKKKRTTQKPCEGGARMGKGQNQNVGVKSTSSTRKGPRKDRGRWGNVWKGISKLKSQRKGTQGDPQKYIVTNTIKNMGPTSGGIRHMKKPLQRRGGAAKIKSGCKENYREGGYKG